MAEKLRLDKYLADMSVGTRSELKTWIRKGRVKVNGVVCRNPETKISVTDDEITIDDRIIRYVDYEYIMLNKPAGVVSATSASLSKTVLDLVLDRQRKDLFPVGRLDKDTEGLLILTNDGELAHNLLSPRKHVDKVYYAKIRGRVTQEDVKAFRDGIDIGENELTMPADLKILQADTISEIELTIREGKFHQVKRMFEAVGKEVTYLKRISMGGLKLDPALAPGEYRSLTEDELRLLKKANE